MGNGGHAFAGALALLGHEVRAWDIAAGLVDAIGQNMTVAVDGALTGIATLNRITTDLPRALEDAAVVLVVVPTVYQASLAEKIAPHLTDDQVVILNPGATGGALEVKRILEEAGRSGVTVAESNNLLYACRSPEPGKVTIKAIKERVDIACLPADDATRVFRLITDVFPQFVSVPTVLNTSLGNINAMMHPLPTLLNAGRCDLGDHFEYYYDGLTPHIAALVEDLDQERLTIANAYGVDIPSLTGWYSQSYHGTGDTLYERVQSNTGYTDIPGPTSLNTRYLFEDVATGLVPLSELGRAAGVTTPLIDAAVELASGLLQTDFRTTGRTLRRLGLEGMTTEEIRAVAAWGSRSRPTSATRASETSTTLTAT